MSEKTILLRMKGSKTSQPFEADHAKRLLAYPNPQWEEITDQADAIASVAGQIGIKASDVPAFTEAVSDSVANLPTKAKRNKAVAAAKKLSANTPPDADTTGQPTSI